MKALAILLLCSTAALAAKKPEPVYQDAVLKSFRTVTTGQSCSGQASTDGTVNANTDPYGNTNGTVNTSTTTRSSCSNNTVAYYTVALGEQIFVLAPALTGKQKTAVILSIGYGALFIKSSSLHGALPGTPVKMRSEDGTIFVKVGKRETPYKVVAAE